MKKILYIIVVFIVIAVLIIGVYLYFFTSGVQTNTTNTKTYSPFGNYQGSSTPVVKNTTPANVDTTTGQVVYSQNQEVILRKISDAPIAGDGIYSLKDGTSTDETVQYVDRATGHIDIYNQALDEKGEIDNTTLPKVYQAYWSNASTSVMMRSLDDTESNILTFLGKINNPQVSSTTANFQPGNTTGVFLESNISDVAVSPAADQFFYLLPISTGVQGITSNWNGSKRTIVYTSAFSDWLPQWPSADTIALTTKASASAPGYLYFIKTKVGTYVKVLGDIQGLTTLTNPTLSYVLYSGVNGSSLSTAIYDVKNNVSLPLSLSTIPSKCVWSQKNPLVAYCAIPGTLPVATYPDDWYQGNVSFADNIWKIDMTNQSMNLVYALPAAESIDAINLSLDATDSYLYFMNKQDNFLWSLHLAALQ